MVRLEGEAAIGWSGLLSSLVKVARPGSLYPDAGRLLQLLEFCARIAPKRTVAEVRLSPFSGLPTAKLLGQLTAMREVAIGYLQKHGSSPSRDAHGWSATLAAAELPPLSMTGARLVTKGGGSRRFLVVHERWASADGCPARFTFHLSDDKGRYLGLDRLDQAQVSEPLRIALEAGCNQSAELAYLQLGALEGVEVGEVVRGQLGPFEAPGLLPEGPSPLRALLQASPTPTGVLHLVLERAARDVAADRSLDPFAPLDAGPEALQRRAALGFRVCRERRLCCPPELHRPLQEHLKSLGASMLIRSR